MRPRCDDAMKPQTPELFRLSVELPAMALNPLTQREIAPHRLPAGTLIEDPRPALLDAAKAGLAEITIHTRDGDGWTGLERVHASVLRKALPTLMPSDPMTGVPPPD